MIALALDAATDILSVALSADDGTRYLEIDAGLRHSERLMELADAALASARLKPSDLNLVACMRGPGSFTGLRIGMSAAKGIASALGIPLMAEPSLDCMASGCSVWPGIVIPVIDAKKGRWFTAVFKAGIRVSEYLDASSTEIVTLCQEEPSILVTGPDAPQAAAELTIKMPNERIHVDPNYRRGNARELLTEALKRFHRDGYGDTDDIGPVYLRKSEAELTFEAKVSGGAL